MTDRETDPEPKYLGVLPSRRRHERADDERVDPGEVLDRLRVLPVHAWQESAENAGGIQHLGPAAEDFYEVFEVDPETDHVPAGYTNGVTMAAIQGVAERLDERDERLERQTRRQQERIEEQRTDLETLREMLESLQSEVSRLRLELEERD